jgi:(heptosyl)LPS beta-1,4-glucosyltransferase
MTTISAAIITLNEERNIERCIDSLKGCVDEIVVLDANSTDRTAEICRAKGVRFVQKEWMGYAAAKNFLNEQTTGDYILSIDADEALSIELRETLSRLKSEGLDGAYSVNRITNYCGKWIRHSGWFPDVKVRLFPRDKARWIGEIVHEELDVDKGTETVLLEGLLEHYSYYDFKQHRERADRYSLMTARKYAEQGKKCGPLKPFFSGVARFFSMYCIQLGFLDGRMGLMIAWISAQSNVLKYRELRRLRRYD